MAYALKYSLDHSLPKLGWIAVADPEKQSVHVVHGEFVECRPDWLVEGAWDGDFIKGQFHTTDTFFGSGVRKTGSKVYFVTATAKTDRIFFCRDQNCIIVSNSLVLLLSYTGASLDDHHDYIDEAMSVGRNGLSNYQREFRIVHPAIPCFYQIYHENIVLENGEITFEPKKSSAVIFESFEGYYQALMEKLLRFRENIESQNRQRSMTAFTTISSGYDAAAVSCLVRQLGVMECFTGRPLDGLLFKQPAESSERIARKLGYGIHPLNSSRSDVSRDELYFLAGNYPMFSKSVWSEISLHSMVKEIQGRNAPAVVFMGYCGDDVWGHKGEIDGETGDLLTNPPISGSNLAEVRLLAGFTIITPAYMFIKMWSG